MNHHEPGDSHSLSSSCGRRSYASLQNCFGDIESDGTLSDDIRDPPGQQSIYITPGGAFEIGRQNTGNVGGLAAEVPPPRRWRMANVISSDHRRFLTSLHLNRELDRLASFSRWPVGRPNVSPAALARTGFFFLGDMDRTQCFSCGGVLMKWTFEDDAMAEHQLHFPNCKMILRTEQRNYKVNELPDPPADRERDYPCRFPSNPHMRNEVARQDTFDRRWPVGRTAATPAEISQAGFFLLGERDRVKCWYCNGGLQNWEYDDDPWIEHAKYFPTCQFLLRVKGQHFVHQCLSVSPHLSRSIIAKQDGATVDPGNAGGSGESRRNVDIPPSCPVDRQSEPTPEIIDPQAEMRKCKERVKNIMENSDLVKNILLMGFDKKNVSALLEDKIESGNVANPEDIYDSMSSLLDDVMKKENELKKEECQMQAAVQIPAVRNVDGAISMAFPSDSSENQGELQLSTENVELLVENKELKEQLHKLKVKFESQKNVTMCKICFNNPVEMVFSPCLHLFCCMGCGQRIRNGPVSDRKCPVCRQKIDNGHKTRLC